MTENTLTVIRLRDGNLLLIASVCSCGEMNIASDAWAHIRKSLPDNIRVLVVPNYRVVVPAEEEYVSEDYKGDLLTITYQDGRVMNFPISDGKPKPPSDPATTGLSRADRPS